MTRGVVKVPFPKKNKMLHENKHAKANRFQ